MNKYLKYIVIVALAVIAFGVYSSLEQNSSKKNNPIPKKGADAPPFRLVSVQGDTVSLSDFKGKVVYIDFWASWCGDCIKEVVPQRQLEKALSNEKDIVFINISIDENEDAWRKAVQRYQLNALQLYSKGGKDENLKTAYNIGWIPRYVIVDKNGKIADGDADEPSKINSNVLKELL